MPIERELQEFATALQSDVLLRSHAGEEDTEGLTGAGDYKENAFTRLLIEELLDAGVIDDGEVCFYSGRVGQGTAKVNGYGISDEDTRLDLFTCIYSGATEVETIPWDSVRRAFSQAVRFLSAAIGDRLQDLEPSSEAFAMAARIKALSGSISSVRVFVLCDGVVTNRTLEPESLGSLPVVGQIWDIERLYRNLGSGNAHEAIEIDLMRDCGETITCLPVPSRGLDYEAYLCVIPADVLYRIYEEYGGRLLELNVRSFLQARGKVNKGIRETIRDDPDHFFPYNNGLSMTAAEVSVERDGHGTLQITRIKGLQIVNGGQTTASIHRARKADRFDLSKIFVQGKLTVVSGDRLEEMVPRISRYANSQNAVNEADFSANHPVHIELERLSLTTWFPGEQGRWFYERARGQYQVARSREGTTPARLRQFDERTPPSRKFSKTDLAKFINTWERKPHIVSRGGQKNFIAFMDALRLRGRGWLPDKEFYKELIAKAILFKNAQKIVADESFEAYRANIVAYTLALLVERTSGQLDLEKIWNTQEVPEVIRRTIRRWSRDVDAEIRRSSEGRNITEWAKKEDCWNAVRRLELQLPPELLRLVQRASENGNGDQISRSDLDNVAACRRMPPEVWLQIHQWATRERRLSMVQRNVVLTIHSYATTPGGWPDEKPTVRQAAAAMTAFNAANELGVLG